MVQCGCSDSDLIPGSGFVRSERQAAGKPRLTLKVNSRAVLVDVIVTDKSGNPVKGLNQSDFTVLEDGKPQSLPSSNSTPLRSSPVVLKSLSFLHCLPTSSATIRPCLHRLR